MPEQKPSTASFTVNGQHYTVDMNKLPTMSLEDAYKIAPFADPLRPHPENFKLYSPEQIYVADKMVMQDRLQKHHPINDPNSLRIIAGPGIKPKPGDEVRIVNPIFPPTEQKLIAEARQNHERCIMYSYDPSSAALYALVGYILLSLIIILIAGQRLLKNSQIFLSRLFKDEATATATNRLLLTGFYLITFGYVLLSTRIPDETIATIKTNATMLQLLASKTGLVVLVIGFMHFLTMLVLWHLAASRNKCNTTE